MSDEQAVAVDIDRPGPPHKPTSKHKPASTTPQFLSTAEAARMLGLSTTLVQTLVDQGDLKGWKTRGGHRRIAMDSVLDYQSVARHSSGAHPKSLSNPKVTVVIESAPLFKSLRQDCLEWQLPIDVQFFESVTEALLDLSSHKPDMLVVEMAMPRTLQIKTFQALENFNQRCITPLSVVLITEEQGLTDSLPSVQSSSIQVVSGPLSSVWLHAYLTGVLASNKL